jgi:arsenite-transporting ATPase
MLRSAGTSVRLVLTPETMVLAEARRSLTQLSLYGFDVDAVFANRLFEESTDPWRQTWFERQQEVLEDVRSSFSPLRVFESPYRIGEPVGLNELTDLAVEVYGDADPLESVPRGRGISVSSVGDGYQLSLRLPLADRADLDLSRVGDDLVIDLAGRRRVISLPSALRRCTVGEARLDAEGLQVGFRPDPGYFPRRTGSHP